jgi:ABC-2 type transport system permease protein
MVGVLIRMKLAVLRRSWTGSRGAALVSGAVVGLAGAGGTLWLVVARGTDAGDLLAVVLFGWAVGWLAGPVVMGTDQAVRREHLALLPLSPRRTATGLLGVALVGVGPAVTLIALTALVAYGVALGPAAAVVAVPAAVLTLLLLALLSQIALALVGALVGGRVSAALLAIPWAALIALTGNSWAPIAALAGSNPLPGQVPPVLATVLRALPSGWPLAAVEAAGRGQWATAGAALAGLGALALTLHWAWARLLRRPAAAPSPQPRGGRSAGRVWPGGRLGAVLGRELRTWSRDFIRIHFLTFAVVYGVVYVVLPLFIGSTGYFPLTGIIVVTLAAACSAHLHSSDGTALWLTLMVPGAERRDVRGRQLAWLVAVGPIGIGLTVAGVLVSGHHWTWPVVSALLPAVLGAGAGVLVLLSVYAPVRVPDPHRRGNTPGQDTGAVAAVVWPALILTVLGAAPALAVVVAGTVRGEPLLQWAATPVGVLTGVALAWGLGRLASRRLATRGPELLQRLGTA